MDCCYGNNFIYFYLLKDSISYLSVISSFCNIVFVRLEYQGDTKMFSSILELNNLSVMYSQKCGGFFFFFTWVRPTWFETCAPVLCSCCTRVIVFDLIGYYIIYLTFSSWWVTPFRDTEIISTEKRCFHK